MSMQRGLMNPVACLRWLVLTLLAMGALCPLQAMSQVPPRFYWKTLSGANAVPLIVTSMSGNTNPFDPANIVVVHDELDIDFGALRLKLGGGEGGHNGLRSISQHLGTKDYLRVRVGVGRPPGRMDPASFVLKPFSTPERKDLGVVIEEAADAAELLLKVGLEAAQNRVHPR